MSAEEIYEAWLGGREEDDVVSSPPPPPAEILKKMARARSLMERELFRKPKETSGPSQAIQLGQMVPENEISDFVNPVGICNGRVHTIESDGGTGPAVRVCPLAAGRQGNCKVVSFGIAYDFQIDNYFLNQMGCEVWSFDPSMKKVDGDYKQGPKHRFFYQGIGDHDGTHLGASTLYGGGEHYEVRKQGCLCWFSVTTIPNDHMVMKISYSLIDQ